MTDTPTQKAEGNSRLRYIFVAVLALGAFFGAYRFAVAQTGSPESATSALSGAQTPGSSADGAACACCGTTAPTKDGVTGELLEGTAELDGDVQKISIDLSKGYYQPNQIVLKAGVPAEIVFGQSSGCTAQVISDELGFSEDLTAGPRTVTLPALKTGKYSFSCGMQMVFGTIVVK